MPRRIARRSILAGLSTLAILALPVPAAGQVAPASPGAAAASQPLTRARLSEQLDTNFKALDTNGDKTLNAAEIEAAQQKSVAQAKVAIGQRLDAEFAKMDGNKDGQLSLTEFKAAAPTPRVAPAAELLGQFDRNKDGKVAPDEYRATPLANFDRIDTNKDGTISAEEQAAAAKRR